MPKQKKEPKRPWLPEAKSKPDKRADTFYTNQPWRNLRNAYIEEHPLCEHCRQEGNYVAAKIVDHIKPRSERPDLELEWSNLQSLCHSHHQSKTEKEKSKKKR